MDMFDLAGTLFGNRRNPVAQGSTITATGSAASADGVAGIVIDADVTPAEGTGEDTDQTVIDVPTSPSVAEGDELVVTLVGEGPLKTPIVMANPGSGDRMQVQVDNAETLAQQAEAVATATGQHFWPDDDGVHVTEVTQDEWNDSTGTSYHSGANVLLNALGQLFRNGLNNLLALVAGTAHSETFTVESYVYDPTYSYMATHTIGVEHIAIQSVIFDGSEFPKFSATTRRGWVYKKSTNLLSLRFHQSDSALGKQVTVNYRTFASMAIYDGIGNDAENIAASFSADDIMLGGSIDGDVDDDKASIRFFGGSVDTETTYIDASGGIGTSNITGDPCYLNREIALGNIVTDSRLYDDSGRRANGFVSFAQSISDSYNTGGETTSSYVNSYVSMYSGTNNVANYAAIMATSVDNLLDSSTSDTETYTEVSARADRLRLEDTSGDAIIPMKQAINVLSSPVTLFTGTYSQTVSSTVTLSETAANFSRMLIEWETADGNQGSTMLSNPNGKRFECVAVNCGANTNPITYIKWKVFRVNGTQISNYSADGTQAQLQRGEIALRNNGSVTTTRNEYIGIIRVLGWR